MKKQKIFIPISAEDEKPVIDQWYFTYTEDMGACQSLGSERFNKETNEFEQEEAYYAQPSHWLKETEGYFFTSEEFNKILGLNEPWPLIDTLKKLIEASGILLYKKDYDGPDWEEIEQASSRGLKYIKLLKRDQ
jgi:hypothetical protein